MGNRVSKVDEAKFIRLSEGAKKYGMCLNTFSNLVREANARYPVNSRMVLVNIERLDAYLETFCNNQA